MGFEIALKNRETFERNLKKAQIFVMSLGLYPAFEKADLVELDKIHEFLDKLGKKYL